MNLDYYEWKIDNVSGTTTWRLRLRCPGDSGYRLLYTFENVSFGIGYPNTETFRKVQNNSDTSTGMNDHHTALQWRASATDWANWPGSACSIDTATNWNGTDVSADHVDTMKVTYDPTPSC